MGDSIKNFENNYTRYQIQKGDTLKSIAEKLNIDFDNLRQYHNSRSKLEDCLAGELRSHLKFLIVPDENETRQENRTENKKRQQVLFISSDFILPFRPFELNHNYSVLYTIQKGETIQTLKQNYSLRRLKPDSKQGDYHFIQADKISKLLIDGKPADTKVYKMAEKTAAILFPLRIVVNKYGKWIDLNSYDKLKERFENLKEEIRDSYKGEIYTELVKNIENDVTDENSLVAFISGNWFLRGFFNGIHSAYTKNFEIEKELYFPAIAELDDIHFLIVQKVEPYLNDLNQIVVMQNGEPEDEYVNGNYRAKYFVNPNNYIIEHFIIECDFIDMDQKIKIEVKNLDESKIILDSGISLLR